MDKNNISYWWLAKNICLSQQKKSCVVHALCPRFSASPLAALRMGLICSISWRALVMVCSWKFCREPSSGGYRLWLIASSADWSRSPMYSAIFSSATSHSLKPGAEALKQHTRQDIYLTVHNKSSHFIAQANLIRGSFHMKTGINSRLLSKNFIWLAAEDL